jgi:hypothetical protein
MKTTSKPNQNDQSKPSMTASQLGKYLAGLTEKEVTELVETTDIPHDIVDGELRFDHGEIRAWVESCAVPAVGPPLTLDELVALHGNE